MCVCVLDEDNWRNDYPDEPSDEEEDSDVDSLDQGYRGKDSYRGTHVGDTCVGGHMCWVHVCWVHMGWYRISLV